MANQHVVPNPNGGWDVKGEGNSKATRHTDTQREAISIAKDIARNQKSEAVIHVEMEKFAIKILTEMTLFHLEIEFTRI